MRFLYKTVFSFACAALFSGAVMADTGLIVKRDAAARFATLPAIANFPEGIAVNPANGDIYVSTDLTR